MPNDLTYFALLQACTEPGCPVCRLEQQAVEWYLSHLFYERINDDPVRAHLRASLGFCREHTQWVLDSGMGVALGMSIIYQDVLKTVLKRFSVEKTPLNKIPAISWWMQRMPAKLTTVLEKIQEAAKPRETCPACLQRERAAQMALSTLANEISEVELQEAFRQSDGLCLPHLRQICAQMRDGASLDILLQVEREKLEHLYAELATFIRKSDYHFLKDGFGAEGNAWRRAAILVAGGAGAERKKRR